MVYDLQLPEGAIGITEGFTLTIRDQNGDLDDLTAYDTVRMTINLMINPSPPTRNHTQADAEISVDVDGQLQYRPTNTNPVPANDKYYISVTRITGTTILRPVLKFSLLVTEVMPTS